MSHQVLGREELLALVDEVSRLTETPPVAIQPQAIAKIMFMAGAGDPIAGGMVKDIRDILAHDGDEKKRYDPLWRHTMLTRGILAICFPDCDPKVPEQFEGTPEWLDPEATIRPK